MCPGLSLPKSNPGFSLWFQDPYFVPLNPWTGLTLVNPEITVRKEGHREKAKQKHGEGQTQVKGNTRR